MGPHSCKEIAVIATLSTVLGAENTSWRVDLKQDLKNKVNCVLQLIALFTVESKLHHNTIETQISLANKF